MSLVRDLVSLICDACGARLHLNDTDATVLRIEASKKGWRYMPGSWIKAKQSGWAKRTSKVEAQRFVDLCPSCEPPEPGSQLTDWTAGPKSDSETP